MFKKLVFGFVSSVIATSMLTGCASSGHLIKQEQIDNDPVLDAAIVGISLYDVEKQQYVYEHNAHKRLVPASNTKLLTTYASLKHLPDSLPGWFVRETADTVFIRPNADPTFLHRDFPEQHMFEYMASSKKPIIIEIFENPAFGWMGSGWSWNSFQSTSFPERSLMPIYGNVVRFHKNGNHVTAFPPYFNSFIHIEGIAEADRGVAINRAQTNNQFTVRSSNSNTTLRPFTQFDDPNLTYQLLADTLLKRNADSRIFWKSIPTSASLDGYRVFHSQPKDHVLGIMMKRSDNMIAEQLLLMVGTELLGYPADSRATSRLLQTDLAALSDSPEWGDGSGLSRNNIMSPRFFTELLIKMEDEFGWDRVTKILPHGNQGTLNNYYQGYESNLFAKTGTLNSTIALSGYLVTKKGKNYVFSVLVNNQVSNSADVRRSVEKILTKIIDN